MKPGTFQLGLILTQLRLSSKLETQDSFREVHNGLLLILHDSHVQYTNKDNYTHIYQNLFPPNSLHGVEIKPIPLKSFFQSNIYSIFIFLFYDLSFIFKFSHLNNLHLD